MSSDLRITPEQATAALAGVPELFVTLLRRQDVEVEYYAPVGEDLQTPHDRDELYVVVQGEGSFSRGDELVDFGPGDLLFVPARVPHRFETFSEGFATWVIFFGRRVEP